MKIVVPKIQLESQIYSIFDEDCTEETIRMIKELKETVERTANKTQRIYSKCGSTRDKKPPDRPAPESPGEMQAWPSPNNRTQRDGDWPNKTKAAALWPHISSSQCNP